MQREKQYGAWMRARNITMSLLKGWNEPPKEIERKKVEKADRSNALVVGLRMKDKEKADSGNTTGMRKKGWKRPRIHEEKGIRG